MSQKSKHTSVQAAIVSVVVVIAAHKNHDITKYIALPQKVSISQPSAK